MTEHPDNSLQQLWQGQPVEGMHMSIDEIRRRAGQFQRRIFWRNAREYAGALLGCTLFALFLVKTPQPIFRAAYALFIAGMVWIVIQLRRKASSGAMPGNMGASTSLQFFLAELERQRDVVKNVWPWYLAPLVPGFIVLTLGYIVVRPFPAGVIAAAVLDVIIAIVFFLIWKMNQRAARCIQKKIDELSGAVDQH